MIDEPCRYRIVNSDTHRTHSKYRTLHAAETRCFELNGDKPAPFLRYHIEEIEVPDGE